jgi:HEAT repeat protein
MAAPRTADQVQEYLVELDPTHVPALARHVQHPDPVVRERVVTALGLIGGTEARAALEGLANDASTEVRNAARVGLARIRLTEQAK